jgi:hypothetical protein
MVQDGWPLLKEDTLEPPEWKDYNFALDMFAKIGFVPWVLSEDMPNADLFIGLSSSIITHKGQRQRVITRTRLSPLSCIATSTRCPRPVCVRW